MAESRNVRGAGCSGQNTQGRSARIMAQQVLDARRARECMEDLRVYFDDEDQALIQVATAIRAVDAEVTDVDFSVQEVPLNNGCYTVDCTYTFALRCNIFLPGQDDFVEATGRAFSQTRSLLYGGCGGVRTFSSDDGDFSEDAPVAILQVSEPAVLQIYITGDSGIKPCRSDASSDNDTSALQQDDTRVVLATIGVFAVLSLVRSIQLTIPVIRAGAPARELSTDLTEDPCQIFRRASFPARKFCP